MNKEKISSTDEYKKDNNACTVVTLSVIADIPFDEAQAVMAAKGRKFRRGMYRNDWLPTFRTFCDLESFRDYEGRAVSVFMREEKRLIENNTIVIQVKGHVFAVQNGVIEDWMDATRRHRIVKMWIVKGRKGYDHTDDYITGREIVEKRYKRKPQRRSLFG